MLERFVGAVGLIVVVLGLALIMSLPVMWLWNYCLIGAVDGVHEIGWLQAWGINILCSTLFKNSGVKS
jgi:hypothetical protein